MVFALGLPAQVVAFLVTVGGSAAAYVVSRRFSLTIPAEMRPRWLRDGDGTFLLGTTLAVLLGMEINGRFVITRGILHGLSFIWPVAKYTGIGLLLYYIYVKYIRGPKVKVVDEPADSGDSGN